MAACGVFANLNPLPNKTAVRFVFGDVGIFYPPPEFCRNGTTPASNALCFAALSIVAWTAMQGRAEEKEKEPDAIVEIGGSGNGSLSALLALAPRSPLSSRQPFAGPMSEMGLGCSLIPGVGSSSP
jgi:hypothetical protein